VFPYFGQTFLVTFSELDAFVARLDRDGDLFGWNIALMVQEPQNGMSPPVTYRIVLKLAGTT